MQEQELPRLPFEVRLAKAYNLTQFEVDEALGTSIESKDLADADDQYERSGRHIRYEEHLRKCIRGELVKAQTPAEIRYIWMKTREHFPEIVSVVEKWNQATSRLLELERVKPYGGSALGFHAIHKHAQPGSLEHFASKEEFLAAFERDLEAGIRATPTNTDLLFALLPIAPDTAKHQFIETFLMKHCETEAQLATLLTFAREPEHRITIIRKLADIKRLQEP